MASYLRRRGGKFVFRRRIPLDVKIHFGRTEIVYALGDSGTREARQIAHAIWLELEFAFMQLRQIRTCKSPAETDTAAQRLLETLDAKMEAHQASVVPGTKMKGLDEPIALSAWYRGLSAASTNMAGRNDIEALTAGLTQPGAEAASDARVIARKFLQGVPAAADRAAAEFDGLADFRAAEFPIKMKAEGAFDAGQDLVQEILTSLANGGGTLAPDLQSRLDGLAQAPDSTASAGAASEPASRAPASVPVASAPVPAAMLTNPQTEAQMLFPQRGLRSAPISLLWGSFADHKVSLEQWDKDEKIKSEGTLKLLVNICGDREPYQYDSTDISELLKIFRELPPLYSVTKEYRTIFESQGAAALVKHLKKQNYVRTSIVTWNKHCGRIREFFKWAAGPGNAIINYVDKTICDGMFIDVPKSRVGLKRRREQQRIWLPGEIERAFNAPVFMGCESERGWKHSGSLVYRNHRYWLTISGVLHGCRREELTLLRVKHVRNEHGVWYFDLMDDEIAPQLKADGSPREIPLHENFLQLGFLEARVQGRDPEARLFADAVSNAVINKNAEPFGKWFGQFRRHYALTRKGVDYHAYRSTVSTGLIDAGVTESYIEEIVGWEGERRRSELDTYNKRDRLQLLKAAIDKWKPPLDIDAMIAAVQKSDLVDRSAAWPDLDAGSQNRAASARIKSANRT